jgi:diphthine methyl ester synthase
LLRFSLTKTAKQQGKKDDARHKTAMVLYMIGLGLGDEDDITLKGYKILKRADVIFLEAYTSILVGSSISSSSNNEDEGENSSSFETIVQDAKERLERAYELTNSDVHIQIADRDLVEQHAEELILMPAKTQTVVFLVVGDPVCATTHVDLHLRAQEMGVECHVIHNASIMGAAGSCGLQLYNFGQTVSIPFFETDGDKDHRPISFYDKILYNRRGGMHTLCLLDIKVKELDYQAIIAGKKKHTYLPPRFMTIPTAVEQLLFAEEQLGKQAYDGATTLCVGLARMGVGVGKQLHGDGEDENESKQQQQQQQQLMVAGTLKELQNYTHWGGPLHSLIICGDLHEIELQALQEHMIKIPKGGTGRTAASGSDNNRDEQHNSVATSATSASATQATTTAFNSSGNPSDEEN